MFNGTSSSDLGVGFYQEGAFYKHKDGGLYKTTGVGKNTTDGKRYVVYQHVFPFAHSIYLRPLEEWTHDRFELLDFMQATDYQAQDRYLLQATITERRAARKAVTPDFTLKTDPVASVGYEGILETGLTEGGGLREVELSIEDLNQITRDINEQARKSRMFSGDADDIQHTVFDRI